MANTASSEWAEALTGCGIVETSILSDDEVVSVVLVDDSKTECLLAIKAGLVVPPSQVENEDNPTVKIPLGSKQLAAIADGTLSASTAYMRGDIKPEGSSRALLAALQLLDDPDVRKKLTAA